MDSSVRQAYDSGRDFSNKAFHSGCYAPFVSLYFNSVGEVLACCKNHNYILGNVATQRLPEIWNGRKINGLRKALKNYGFGAGCEFCEWQIAGGKTDGAFTVLYENYAVDSMEPEWPAVIEFAGSNTCNFECVMCRGELSSAIRAHREGLPPLPKVYSDQFFEDLRKFLPHLREAKFLGGEPFLAQECFRIWDMMIEDGLATPCNITTNGSQYNAKVERVLEALPVSLCVSVDGATKGTVEKIRVNCKYEDFRRNLDRFRQYTKQRGTWLVFSHCLMRDNWHEFGDILLMAEEMECSVWVNTVVSPAELSLYTLPPQEILRIVDQMETQGSRLESRLQLNRKTWDAQLLNLRSNANGRIHGNLTKIQGAVMEAWNDVLSGWKLISAGRFEDAVALANQVQETDPSYYYWVTLRSDAWRLLGKLDRAEQDLELCMKLSRRLPDAYLARAILRLDQHRFDEGIVDALQARELSGHTNKYLERYICETLAFLYGRKGLLSEAEAELERLVQLQPADAGVRVSRAQVFQIVGRNDQAHQEVQAALALDPNLQEALKLNRELRT